jgi:hypothetical protein
MTPEVQESVRQHHDEICHKIFERAKALCKEKNVSVASFHLHSFLGDCLEKEKREPVDESMAKKTFGLSDHN